MTQVSAEFILYSVAIHRAMNLTYARFQALNAFFEGDFSRVWHASQSDLFAAKLDKIGREKLLENRRNISPEAEMERVVKAGAKVLVFGAPDYPLHLGHIYNPPALLFCRGNLKSTDFPALAVVGSRQLSSYGQRVIEKIVAPIAARGVCIVSGLAFGTDLAAHKIALQNGARTIAVLGNGIDDVYPHTNKKFAEKFLAEDRGVVLSEYLPGTTARPEHFPHRNRIVSGLSRGTFVVEAAVKSGSLITAELALEQGKDVFVAPGDLFTKNAQGGHYLLKKGQAQAVTAAEDIVSAFGWENVAQAQQTQMQLPTNPIENQILSLFESGEPIHIDDLCRQAPCSHSEVRSSLAILELKGFVKNQGQQNYTRSH